MNQLANEAGMADAADAITRAFFPEGEKVYAVRLDVEPGPSRLEEMLADPDGYHQRAVAKVRGVLDREVGHGG